MSCYYAPPCLHSFPTRRSSDLPLWGVRLRPRLMHDGASLTLRDAIVRHRGEASGVSKRFGKLTQSDQEAIITFLKSLDRKSTRLNSSHRCISYAVFCLKKKKNR